MALAGFATALVAGSAAADSDADARLRTLAAEAGQVEPLMRIGLEPAADLRLSCRGAFRVLDPASGRAVWLAEHTGTLQAVADGAPAEGAATVYRVQVGAFATKQAAEQELVRLRGLVGESEGVVRHDPDRGTWRVRLGEAADRLALGPLTEALREAGVEQFWIAAEPLQVAAGVRIRLVDRAFESRIVDVDRVAIVPAGGEAVEVDGQPYRGVIELRVTPFGTLRAINWIALESYLLGVVPAELGPEVWPQMQALKAQAVAARTYAWRNRGQFGDEGFDICATPRCQVYGGMDVEHPMTDRAVAETRGEVLVFDGEPIVALYTSTCGGHTEDGSVVFADHEEPYLKGVPCRAEGEAMATLRGTLDGRRLAPLRDETGADATRDWALLRAAGVIAGDDPAASRTPLTAATLRGLTASLARLAGLPPAAGNPSPIEGLGQAAAALLEDLGWGERAAWLLDGADLPALLRDAEAAALPADQARALGYLASIEVVRPFPDGSYRAADSPTAARLLPALVRIGESYRAFGLREAVVSGVGDSSLRLVQGKGALRLAVAERPFLFAPGAGSSVAAERLEVWPGDRVRFRVDGQGRIDFLELMPPLKGVADDRASRLYSWEERRTRRELETTINARVAIGRLRDLRVLRRGVSGRVAELQVEGSAGSTIVRGFDVRRMLDLRESLTVVEIQRDADGEIDAVVFAGKGWGHGVGLCQVGAYGMALRGADYRAILAHYYRGTELQRLRR